MSNSKKYRQAKEKIGDKPKSIEEAVKLVKEIASAKFDESVEVHFNLGIDPKNSEQIVKGILELPHGTGKSIRVAVFTESKEKEAKDAKADLVGGLELVDEILKTKKTNFEAAVATPDFMRNLAKAAKILGTRGLMPTPKNGTVTDNVADIVGKLKSGQINFRNDSAGNIHQIIGKTSWEDSKLIENIESLRDEINRRKPKGIKGAYVKSITICSTMGPGIKVNI